MRHCMLMLFTRVVESACGERFLLEARLVPVFAPAVVEGGAAAAQLPQPGLLRPFLTAAIARSASRDVRAVFLDTHSYSGTARVLVRLRPAEEIGYEDTGQPGYHQA